MSLVDDAQAKVMQGQSPDVMAYVNGVAEETPIVSEVWDIVWIALGLLPEAHDVLQRQWYHDEVYNAMVPTSWNGAAKALREAWYDLREKLGLPKIPICSDTSVIRQYLTDNDPATLAAIDAIDNPNANVQPNKPLGAEEKDIETFLLGKAIQHGWTSQPAQFANANEDLSQNPSLAKRQVDQFAAYYDAARVQPTLAGLKDALDEAMAFIAFESAEKARQWMRHIAVNATHVGFVFQSPSVRTSETKELDITCAKTVAESEQVNSSVQLLYDDVRSALSNFRGGVPDQDPTTCARMDPNVSAITSTIGQGATPQSIDPIIQVLTDKGCSQRVARLSFLKDAIPDVEGMLQFKAKWDKFYSDFKSGLGTVVYAAPCSAGTILQQVRTNHQESIDWRAKLVSDGVLDKSKGDLPPPDKPPPVEPPILPWGDVAKYGLITILALGALMVGKDLIK